MRGQYTHARLRATVGMISPLGSSIFSISESIGSARVGPVVSMRTGLPSDNACLSNLLCCQNKSNQTSCVAFTWKRSMSQELYQWWIVGLLTRHLGNYVWNDQVTILHDPCWQRTYERSLTSFGIDSPKNIKWGLCCEAISNVQVCMDWAAILTTLLFLPSWRQTGQTGTTKSSYEAPSIATWEQF